MSKPSMYLFIYLLFATKHQQYERAASAAPQTLDQSENAHTLSLNCKKNKKNGLSLEKQGGSM